MGKLLINILDLEELCQLNIWYIQNFHKKLAKSDSKH